MAQRMRQPYELAHHNTLTHKKHCPSPDGAKAIFEGQPNVLVSRRLVHINMKGVGANLDAALKPTL